MITQEKLKQLVFYENGSLIAKYKYSDKICIGKKIGTKNKLGYYQASINKTKYYLHRLIFLYHYGYMPKTVDHIDKNKSNNNIENLREASLHENNYNTLTPKTNKSGVKNVHWNKKNKKWNVTLSANNKSMYFGSFDDLELAELVAIEARSKYHGQFACHE